MPQRGDIPVNNFVRGLVTEASPLTFPPGASLDEVNFELLRDGSRQRRLGLDLEDNYGLHTTSLDAAVLEGARCQAYRWSIPNGHIDQDIGVIQIGNQIWFIDLFTANPSANILNGGNPIVATELNNDVIMTFTTLNNYLIGVANHLAQPYLFNYDPVTDTVSVETASITIRDMWGVDDGLAVDGRPTALSAAHHYNLLNQGWLPTIESTCGAGVNAIDCTFNTFGVYPSNSDAWTYGRVEDLTSVDLKKFDPDIAGRNFVNNGNVARGHYLISLYERGVSRSNQTGLTLPVDRETGRINAIAAFAGRIFYAGILSNVVGGDSRSPNLSGTVLFSQLFENKLNLVKCYQEADPTSPDINDIVDTDGGLIQIPECGYIWALKAIKESLFVFASNGVWEIRGGDNGFTATSFMVNKISNVGVYAPKSIVEVEGIIYFWAATGIHAIGRNENGVFQTSNLTIPTIQKLYNAIPDASKKNARGYYDLAQNRARWLYYSPETKEFGEAIDIDETPVPTIPSVVSGEVATTITTSVNITKVARISDTSYIIVYFTSDSLHLKGVVCSVDPDTAAITMGSEITINAANSGDVFDVVPLSSTKILVAYGQDPFTDTFTRVLTISGLTFTAGAANTHTGITSRRLANFNATTAVLAYDAGANAQARLLTIAGDVVTAGSAVNIGTLSAIGDIERINSSKAVFIGEDGSGRSAVILSATDPITVGTPLLIAAWTVDSLAGITIAVGSNGSLIHLSGRSGASELKTTQMKVSDTDLTREVSTEYTSVDLTINESQNHWNAVLQSNIAVNIAADKEVTRYPYIETSNISSLASTVRTSRTLLATKTVARLHCTRLSESMVVWSAANGASTGPLITQAVKIT